MQKFKKRFIVRRNGGFTLVELLVVIAVISILVSGLIVLVDPAKQLQKARDTQRKQDMAQLQRGLEQFNNDNNKYPCASGTVASGCVGGNVWAQLIPEFTSGVSAYFSQVPKDPTAASSTCPQYTYSASSDFKRYAVFANLENSQDTDAMRTKPDPSSVVSGSACSGGCAKFTPNSWGNCQFNYWVMNP